MPQLTTPITEGRTATQYQLQSVHLDLSSNTITVTVELRDAQGDVVSTKAKSATFASSSVQAVDLQALATKVVTYLKAQGVLN